MRGHNVEHTHLSLDHDCRNPIKNITSDQSQKQKCSAVPQKALQEFGCKTLSRLQPNGGDHNSSSMSLSAASAGMQEKLILSLITNAKQRLSCTHFNSKIIVNSICRNSGIILVRMKEFLC